MFFLKKVFLGLGFIFLISLGGFGTQSNSLIMQGIGFIGIIVGLVILYIFGRMVWNGLGCLPSFLILSAIVLFMMYTLGMFNQGLGGVGQAMIQFLGYKEDTPAVAEEQPEAAEKSNKVSDMSEDFPAEESLIIDDEDIDDISPDLFAEETTAQIKEQENSKPKKSIVENVAAAMSGSNKPQQQQAQAFNPNNYPVVYGSVTVITGDTLEMYGKYFRLFGIDAPESNQTCADKQGRSYNCGREAAMWLKSWIGDNELECHVVQQDTKGNMIGTCSYGPYDLGAALVNAGWAVSNPRHTDIYSAYEIQAQQNRRGLWQGSFYKPWDWRKIQQRKPKIKVLRPKERKTGIFG